MNARGLHHRAHRPARDHAGTRRCGLQEHPARSETSEHFVRDRPTVDQGYPDQRSTRLVYALANRFGYFAGFAQTDADDAGAVSDHHQRTKAEVTTTFHNLGHAIDIDNPVVEFVVVGIDT